MMITNTRHLSKWRIGVCGSSHDLADGIDLFCEAIGRALGRRDTVLPVHGGLKRRAEARPGTFAADWHFIAGIREIAGIRLEERVETVVADVEMGNSAPPPDEHGNRPSGLSELFFEGRVHRIRGSTYEARRFSFVRSLDALIGVGGGTGTSQALTLALALELPVLPVLCFPGRAKRHWDDNRAELIRLLQIDDQTAKVWEATPRNRPAACELAEMMVERLLARLPRRAFVIMPFQGEFDTLFDLIIEPSIRSWGDEVIRLDRDAQPGSVTEHIKAGLRSCDYVVAVLDGWRPNVLYELGFARALGKPSVLLLRREQERSLKEIPFDISTLHRLEYDRPDRILMESMRSLLGRLVPREGAHVRARLREDQSLRDIVPLYIHS